VPDNTGQPVWHPDVEDIFGDFEDGRYPLQFRMN
jgi:heat shock protein HspQ